MKKICLKRLLSVVLAVVTVLPLVPVFALPVSAATISASPEYKIEVKNSNVKKAGTDNDVYCLIETVNGITLQKYLDSSADDFERNDCRTYSFTLDFQPWEIKKVGIKHSGGINAVRIDWFKFYLPNGSYVHQNVDRWFEKDSQKYTIWGSVDRQITARGNFDSEFSGTKYFAPNVTSGQSDIVMSWNGKVTDQYYSEYTMLDYAGAVGVTFSASGKSYGYSSLTFDSLTENNLAEVGVTSGLDTKLTLKTNALLAYMKANKIYKLTITSTLDYNFNTDEYPEYSTTYTVYRTGFELLGASAITTAYTPETRDNYFYNSDPAYKTFVIKIPVRSLENYNASTIASSLAANIKSGKSKAKVYYDTLASGSYVTPKNAYSSGSDIYLVCDAPAGYANNDNVSITAVIENAQATYSGQTYTLDTDNSYYQSYISTHKVDTKGLTHTVKNSENETVDPSVGFAEYATEHSFYLAVDSGQSIYIDNGKGGRTEGNFSYRLYDKNGKEIPLVKHNGLKATSNVPHAGNSLYRIAATQKVEGSYVLKISSRDFANNLSVTTIPVNLDTIAPRASYSLKQVLLVDGSKRNEYTFNIVDSTGTGRLYYTFVRDGYAIPDPSDTKPETSGPEDTLYEKWGFIDQTNAAKTVVLSLPDGDYFKGTLYWYTTDAAGNDSRTEKNSGTNGNGYYYTAVELSNVKTNCDIILDDVTPGKPSYEIAFETSSLNTVEYRWVGQGIVTATTVYNENSTPGAAIQYNGSGKAVVMNGEYTLEYTVITPDGARTPYTRTFIFDNTAPELTVRLTDTVISDTQGVTITAKDIVNITSVRYQLYTASDVAVGEEIELTAGLPVISEEILLSPSLAGNYKVKVVVTDKNGQTTQAYSPNFDIRVAAPTVTASHDVDPIDGIAITSSPDYFITIDASEEIKDLGSFSDEQVAVYRASSDGISFTDWQIAPSYFTLKEYTNNTDGRLKVTVSMFSPIALNPGENTIFVELAFVTLGTEPETVRAELIGRSASMTIVYDNEAPKYKLEIDTQTPRSGSVVGTVTYYDNYTEPGSITISDSSYYIAIQTPEVGENAATAYIVINNNVSDGELVLTDKVGNEAVIPIVVNSIDREPPVFEAYGEEKRESGARQDYYLSFFIDHAMDEETLFALIDGDYPEDTTDPSDTSAPRPELPVIDPETMDDSLFGPIPSNDAVEIVRKEIVETYENGETKVFYEVLVRADEETMPSTPKPAEDSAEYEAWYNEWKLLNERKGILVVKTEDALENQLKRGISFGMTLVNATPRVVESSCAPEIAHNKSVLSLEMSVPVYIIPDSLVPDAIKAMALPDGRLDTSDDDTVLAFAELVDDLASRYFKGIGYEFGAPDTHFNTVVEGLGEKAIYFADECGRVYKQTITVKDISEKVDGTAVDPYVVYASFGNELPVDIKLYHAEYNADEAEWTELSIADFGAYKPFAGYDIYVVITPASDLPAEKTVALDLLDSSPDFSLDTGKSTSDKLYYKLSPYTGNNALLVYSGKVTAQSEGGDLTEEIGSAFELVIKDLTPPELEVYYSVTDYTNKAVTVNIFAYDIELSQNSDEGDENAEGSDPTAGEETAVTELTAAEKAERVGIQSIGVSAFTTEYVYDPGSLEYTDLGQISETTLTFEENGYYYITVTNTLGLSEYFEIEVGNINREDITEGENGDYTVGYYYKAANGEYQPIEDGKYYKEVYASIDLVLYDDGYGNEISGKGITVTNNGGLYEKLLTAEGNTFTFMLRDMFGNTKNVDVEFNRFDLEGPSIGYELGETGKTNQPYDVSIIITDLNSEPGTVTVTDPFGLELPASLADTVNDGGVITKTFTVTVSGGGIYAIKATDVHGNATERNITINNIETVAPAIAQKMATVTAPTTQTVGIKLYYSEPNVVLTRVEVAEGTSLTVNDITVDHTNSTIRFNENGTVSVWFTDEYGNVGVDTVTVNNICRTPPSLSAVQTVANDLLSVSVRFEKNQDEKRELSELYVLHGGITPMYTETDENGEVISERVLNASEVVFTVIDNGIYTFYAYDSIGNIQEISVKVTGIDRDPPVITKVEWTYVCLDENGAETTAVHSLTPGSEVGYSIVEDENYTATNKDITATVTTDKLTKFVGAATEDYTTSNSIIYSQDGWFNFDMVRPNGLMDRYGLGLYLIDKVAPVIEDVEDLIFFENPNAGTPYDKALLTYSAYDERYGVKTDLTSKVEIDWGGFKPENSEFSENVFDKNKPYTVTYTVKDSVGNVTVVKRTITLVGLFDTMVLVNGEYPDSSGRMEVLGSSVELTLDNFSGLAYARYESGVHTMGEMKRVGTVITPENGAFKLEGLEEGWYTFYVQTDLRDYFCVNVYVYNK